MLLDAGVHVIPRLRARCKDIHHWVIDRWIVQAARRQTQNIWQSLKLHGHLAAAGWAKTTFNRLAGVANDFVVTWFAANLNRGFLVLLQWQRRRCQSLVGISDSDNSTLSRDRCYTRNGWHRRRNRPIFSVPWSFLLLQTTNRDRAWNGDSAVGLTPVSV
jgi:hypothetical protein